VLVRIHGEKNNPKAKIDTMENGGGGKKMEGKKTSAGNKPAPGEIWAVLMVKQVELLIQHDY